jgi:hypothetical protein
MTKKIAPHSGLREKDERRDHIDIFREFLDHLGRASRGGDKAPAPEEVRIKH